MRILLADWTGKDLGLVETARVLRASHDIVYWTCGNVETEIDPREFPNTVLHEHADAVEGIPAKVLSGLLIPPPGAELLDKLSDAESVVLTMMNKHFEEMGIMERKHLYTRMVGYWDVVLKRYRPEAILFPTVPHNAYDFVIYSLAKHYGIRTLMFELTWVQSRMYILDDYRMCPDRIAKTLHAQKGKTFSLDLLPEDLQKEYRTQTGSATDATPIYLKQTKNAYSGMRLIKAKVASLLGALRRSDFSVVGKLASYPFRQFVPDRKSEYERVTVLPDFTKKSVYVALQYQPERTSCPQGGQFVDQILMVEMLSATLPDGWVIHVKEHPAEWWYRGLSYFSYRFKGYYERLARLPGVRVVPMETSTYELTKHAEVVATLRGTAGWEAIMRQKPVLVFGYPWYWYAPGTFLVRDSASCSSAFANIRTGRTSNEADILRYLSLLSEVTFPGYVDAYGKKIFPISPEQNGKNLARELERNLIAV